MQCINTKGNIYLIECLKYRKVFSNSPFQMGKGKIKLNTDWPSKSGHGSAELRHFMT